MNNMFKGQPLRKASGARKEAPSYNMNTELQAQLDDSEVAINVELVQQGKDGASIEFQWRGTELGIRVEGEEEYVYMDLTSDMEIDREVLINTLGFEPAQADLLQKHLDDMSKHITPEERIRWNEGVNADEVYKRIAEVENGTVDIQEYELHVQDSFSMMDEMRGNLADTIKTFNKSISDLNEAKADRLKVIEQLDGKANKIHNHDALYASKIELDEKIKALELVIPAKISELEDDIEIVTMEFLESLKLNDAYDDIEKLKLEKAALSFVEEQVLNLQKQIDAITSSISEGDIAQIKANIESLKASKVDKVEGKGLSSIDLTDILYEKLLSVEKGAKNYKHPDTHSAEMIIETPNKRFVSDFQKDLWNNKADKTAIPTKTSQLVNDSGYATLDDIPNLSGEFEKINAQLSLLGDTKLSKAEHKVAIAKLQTQIDNIDIAEETLNAINEQISKLDVDKADKSELAKEVSRLEGLIANISVPTKVSELVNDAGYITSADKSITALKGDIEELKLNKADNIKLTSEIARVEGIIAGLDIPEEVDLTPITKAITQLETGKLSIVEFEKRLSEEILALIGEAPETLDTLGELAKALGEDPNFATTMTNMIAKKVSTDVYNAKIAEIEDTIENLDIPEDVDLRPVYAAIEKLKTETVQLTDFNEQISKLATISSVTEQLALKADRTELPKKLSELLNDTGFITKSDIPVVDLEPLKTDITALKTEKADKESIPTKLSQLANDSGYIKIDDVPETDLKPIETRLANVEQNKANKTDIPTKVGQLTNDKGYITLAQVPEVDLTPINTEINTLKETKANQATLDNAINGVNLELAKKALKTDIPTMLSQLINDSKFITLADVPVVDLEPLKKSISAIDTAKADKSYVDTQIESVNAEMVNKANVEDIPTKISKLENDKSFITPETLKTNPDIAEIKSNLSDKIDKSEKGKASGIVPLDKNSQISLEYLPDISKQQVYIVNTKEEMEKLSNLIAGDRAYILDSGDAYIWNGEEWKVVSKAEWANVKLDWTHIENNPISEVDLSNIKTISEKANKTEIPTKISQLADDTTFKEDISNLNKNKVDKEVGKSLSTNDYTDKDKELVSTISTKAEKTHSHKIEDIELLNEKLLEINNSILNKAEKSFVEEQIKEVKTLVNNIDIPEVDLSGINKQLADLTLSKADKEALELIQETINSNKEKWSKDTVYDDTEVKALIDLKADKKSLDSGLSKKVDKVDGKTLSTNDYSDLDKIEVGKVKDKADKTELPTKLSELTNDTKFITLEEVPETDLSEINSSISALEDSKASKTELSGHTGNVTNPHKVTKAQVGLSNVDNTSDLNKPISKATKEALELKADKTSIASKLSQLENDSKYITLAEVPETDFSEVENSIAKLEATKANKSEVDTHIANVDNPHKVTKAQIGLSNVDNTKDVNKPISTPTKTYVDKELATKQNTIGYTPENVANKGEADGYTPLDANAKVPLQYIPDIAKQQTYVVETKEEMDELSKLMTGEKCYVTGVGDSYIWNGTAWQVLSQADWENVNLDWENITNRPKSSQSQIDGAVTDSHKHANKTVLDKITDAMLNKIEQAFNHISDAVKHITGEERKLWNTVSNKADKTELTTHTSNASNPHEVTKGQVGLGNVDNTADSTKNVLSATKLTTARTINEVSFDGTSNIIIEDSTKEPKFTKNTAFNKNFGTTAGTVAQGNDSRLSDARTPLAHNHNTLYNTKTEVSDLLDSKADKSYVDNIEVGGRNYFSNSDFREGMNVYWQLLDGSPPSNFEIVGSELKVAFNSGTTSNFGRMNFLSQNNLEGQDYITVSSLIRGNGTLRIRFGASTMPMQTINNEQFKRVIFTIPRSNFGNGNLILEVASGTLYFYKIKAETGNKATDWTPSPEEVENLIDGKVDKSQVLTNVPLNAKFTDTVYTHPSNHPASMITESTTKRFVSDTEKSTWNAKASTSVATISADGLMANTDKAKLDGVQAGAQVNTVTSVAGKTGAVTVTKGDVALDNVLNYGLSTQSEAETGTSNAKYMTPLRTKQAIDKQVADKNYVTQDELGDAGFGDMLKSIYDTNNNGIVDNAEKVNGFTVGTNVPSNAKFTDTNTTYSEITTSEIDIGTATTLRTITGRRVQYILDKVGTMISTAISALNKSSVGLGNVDNTSDANKPISVATQKALDTKANKVDVTASLELKANKTDVPTKVSQLSNDSKFITLTEVPEVDLSTINSNITKLQDGKADKTDVPTKLSELTNDTKFITLAEVPKTDLTQINSDINTLKAAKADKTFVTEELSKKANKTEIPTKVSQLQNDSGFDIVEDTTTKIKYKIIMENGIPYFEEI